MDFNFYFPQCDGDTSSMTVIGQAGYTQPTDFARVEQGSVIYDRSPLDLADYDWLKNRFIDLTTTGTPTFYYLRNQKLNLYPAPDSVKQIQWSYRKKPTNMVNNTDSCFLSDDFDQAITFYAAYLCFNDYDKDFALSALQNYNQEKENVITLYNFNDETLFHFDYETVNG